MAPGRAEQGPPVFTPARAVRGCEASSQSVEWFPSRPVLPWAGGTQGRERRPPVGTAARSAAKGVYHAPVRMTLNAPDPGRSPTIPALGVLLCRPPAAACADQRSAFPCRRVALPRPKPNHPRSRGPSLPAACGGLCRRHRCPTGRTGQRSAFPCRRVAVRRAKPNHPLRSRGPCLPAACGGLCRPEVGVPLPARRCAPVEAEPSPQSGSFSAGRLRRPVPTRGRRSLAARRCAPVEAEPSPSQLGSLSAGRLRRPVPAPTGRTGQRSAFPCLRVACAGRSRTIPFAVGVLVCRPPAAACAGRPPAPLRERSARVHPLRSRGRSLACARGRRSRRSALGEAEPSPLQSGSLSAGRLRRPVPGPTGRTAQRSAFPCLRVVCAYAGPSTPRIPNPLCRRIHPVPPVIKGRNGSQH